MSTCLILSFSVIHWGPGSTAVGDYATVAREAVREMHRQVGDLVIEDGIARRGLLVRHLVMPGMLEDSRQIFQFLVQVRFHGILI